MSKQLLLSLARALGLFAASGGPPALVEPPNDSVNEYQVLILGGGIAGVMAARELSAAGVENYLLVEARDELGGRLRSHTLENGLTVELGANWIEGLHSELQSHNPIWKLAKQHGLQVASNNWQNLSFYDQHGENHVEFPPQYQLAKHRYKAMLTAAGHRIANRRVDTTARTGYKLSSARIEYTQYDHAAEYYQYDWEYGQPPEQSSWIATAINYNRTFETSVGGFGAEDKMCIDQRGFKHFLLEEAASFLKSNQTLLSSTVKAINYTGSGVAVLLSDGNVLTADQALVTFSVGVLQHDDVLFHPPLPSWKVEAIESMKMATYTKIFLVFDEKFWHDTQMGLYAHPHKRGYFPVWQSLDHDSFFPGKHVYFVTVTGDESERLESMSDADVQEEVMEVLKHMYPHLDTIPTPKQMVMERWFTDPLYRGSWSNWPPSFYIEHMHNLQASLEGTLHFAGEATSQDFYGYLHGAYFEGVERGQMIARCVLDVSGCLNFPDGGDFEDATLLLPMYDM
ncbi:amine oxidase [Clavulina sp. PMI_390]|nr:amine oxidase [Clavulina sp. PMI_390]